MTNESTGSDLSGPGEQDPTGKVMPHDAPPKESLAPATEDPPPASGKVMPHDAPTDAEM
jgi:hypothetical protein